MSRPAVRTAAGSSTGPYRSPVGLTSSPPRDSNQQIAAAITPITRIGSTIRRKTPRDPTLRPEPGSRGSDTWRLSVIGGGPHYGADHTIQARTPARIAAAPGQLVAQRPGKYRRRAVQSGGASLCRVP